MWIMEETDGPSRDPPQMGHLHQKVHAQQSPASSSEKRIMSPRMTFSSEVSQNNEANEAILSQKVYGELSIFMSLVNV